MLASHGAQVALRIVETGGHTVLAIGLLGAIKCATTHLGGEVGAGNAEDLFVHNMVDTLLQVWKLLFEACQEPFCNLAQEDTALAARVEEPRLAGTEQLRRQQVEHSVGQLRRGEDLITAQIGQAVKDIGAIVVLHIDRVGCNAKEDRCALVHRNSVLRLAHQRGCTGGFG